MKWLEEANILSHRLCGSVILNGLAEFVSVHGFKQGSYLGVGQVCSHLKVQMKGDPFSSSLSCLLEGLRSTSKLTYNIAAHFPKSKQ